MSNLLSSALGYVAKNKEVFLGGTTNNDTWRVKLISMLGKNVGYFNPVVMDYDEAAKAMEDIAKENATHMVYVITPNMKSFYSIAEMTEDAVLGKRPVIVCFTQDSDKLFTKDQFRTIQLVLELLSKYSCVRVTDTIEDVANILNE